MTAEPDRITAHAAVTTHVDDALAALATQLRGKPRIDALVRALLGEAQAVEDDVWELYALGIDDSSDHALDQLGALLGQARPTGTSDAVYRSVLRAVVLTLKSSGTGDELLRVMREMVGSYDFTMTLAYPASLVFEPDAPGDVSAAVALEVLRRGASAGVRLQVISVPEGDVFTLSADMELSSFGDEGLSDAAGATGGQLAGVVST